MVTAMDQRLDIPSRMARFTAGLRVEVVVVTDRNHDLRDATDMVVVVVPFY